MHGFHDRALALLFAIGLLLFGAALANAGPYEDALAGLTTDSFGDTADAIDTLSASGDPRTGPLLEALKDQRLLFSADAKRVFIKDKSDRLTDAASGAMVATPPADIEKVRLNNRVRGMLDAALGSLTLMAKEPGRRFEAAQAVFKSRDAGALPNIDKALEKEADARVRKALTEARAAILLSSAETSPDDKIAAIAVIRDRGDQDALGLIDSLPVDLPPAVRQAAASASKKIQGDLALWN
ncbi:MAG TPA: urea ABC transporter permease subunit UrtB, partial [Pseudolabrys sp.]|nr:urea ABC transporter permease subunit UrtB [Pseudolabrys sp.]